MNLTEEEYRALAPYERHFSTAVNARWTRNPGREALTLMQRIYNSITGKRFRLNYGCGTCILHLVQDCGRLWLAGTTGARAQPAAPGKARVRLCSKS